MSGHLKLYVVVAASGGYLTGVLPNCGTQRANSVDKFNLKWKQLPTVVFTNAELKRGCGPLTTPLVMASTCECRATSGNLNRNGRFLNGTLARVPPESRLHAPPHGQCP